jgi:hypothetical protein
MPPTQPRCPKEEFAIRGDAIYESDISPQLKPGDKGKFVAIDIETKVFEVDPDELKACQRLRARVPQAQIWLVRAGSRCVQRFGGHRLRATPGGRAARNVE